MNELPPNKNLQAEPTAEEIATAAAILSKLRPGFLPLPIFLETTRLTATPIVEVVPLRMLEGRVQVLLTQREADDPNWPGMLHTPGTVVRSTDQEGSYASAFSRILDDELASVELTGEPITGTFHDIESLPENVVDTQIDFIRNAASAFAEGQQ